MRKFPQWKFAMFGLFDGSAAFLFSIGAPNTPATIQNIINQAIIPLTMFASFIILRARYPFLKIGGATIILGGAFIALIPIFRGNDDNDGTKAVWYSILIYFLNNIPQSLSNVTKEWAFQRDTLDVYYLGSWVAWYQLAISLMLIPVTSFPGFGHFDFFSIPKQIFYGLKCFAGINSLPGDECSYNYIATSLYILINFVYNILILLVTKYASATLFTLAFALRLPLTQIVYSLHFIMRQFTEPFTWETIVALFVVLFGFAIYSASSTTQAGQEEGEKIVIPTLRGGIESVPITKPVPKKRDVKDIRSNYFTRLGINTPPPRAENEEDQPYHASVDDMAKININEPLEKSSGWCSII